MKHTLLEYHVILAVPLFEQQSEPLLTYSPNN